MAARRAARSSARRLKKMIEIREERYPAADWNIYALRPPTATIRAATRAACVDAAHAIDPAALPVLRLYRDRRRARTEHSSGRGEGAVARLRRAQDGRRISPWSASPAAPTSSRVPRAVPKQPKQRAAHDRALRDPARPRAAARLLFDGAEWDFATLDRVYKAIEEIALEELGLDVYPNQIEIISAEQMLDAYSSVGMPLMYAHWSFGKLFAREETLYREGYQALAYEIVINSNPCITYCMEENTMTMQTLVIAHAAFGHNHFFKNNYLFQQWTDPTEFSTISPSPSDTSRPARSATASKRSRRCSTRRMR